MHRATEILLGLQSYMRMPQFRDSEAEKAFWARYNAQIHAVRIFFMAACVVIFIGFAALDIAAGGENASTMLIVRTITALIMIICLTAVCMPCKTVEVQDHAFEICTLGAGFSIVIFILLAPSETTMYYQFALTVVFSVMALILMLRFATILRVTAMVMGAYILTLPWHTTNLADCIVATIFNTLVAVAVVIGSYERERLVRLQAIMGDAMINANDDLRTSQRDAVAARDEAIAANRAKSHFLASVSHELRTPMNAILGFSGMINSEIFGPVQNAKYSEYVEHIHNSGQLLQANIDDLLDIARFEAGKIGWVDETFIAHEVLDSAIATCQAAAQKAGVTVAITHAAHPMTIEADPMRISQAVINLVTNAVKFSDSGQRVDIRVVRDSSGDCLIHVADNGCGISIEQLAEVRKPFAQAHADSYSKSKGGLGLGLSIVSGIVTAMEGRLDLESEQGVGTTATLVIPARRIGAAMQEVA